ncbi:MAG: hypothetical protein IKY44_01685, partial [Clostridia bacterium]|nr:hypothetical protein [Clostridia bacterium]
IGKTPTFAKVNADKYYSENFTGVSNSTNGVTWTNQSSGINLTISNPFKEGNKYTLTYYLTAKEGYIFTGATTVKINGQTAAIAGTAQDEDGKDIKVKVSLKDITPKDNKQEISSLNLNVTAPQNGAKPDFTKITGTGYYTDNGGNSPANYKNGIMWFNETSSSTLKPGTTSTFAENNKYSVTIVVLAENTHKFASTVTAKVNGKTATVDRIDDGSVVVKYSFAKLSVSHTHTESDWKTDGTHHWKVCTDSACGVVTTPKTAHLGGTATCTDKARCSVCNAEYGTTTDHISGPAATETTPQTCTECGFIIKAALNHTHKLTKVGAKDATCTEPGNTEYYTCSGCPELFSDADGTNKVTDSSVIIAPEGHKGGEWVSDESFHWQECTACSEVLIETKMLHEDADDDGKCDTCGFELSGTQEPTTTPDNTPTDDNNGGEPISVLTWVIIGAAFVVLLAALIIVIAILAKKKK